MTGLADHSRAWPARLQCLHDDFKFNVDPHVDFVFAVMQTVLILVHRVVHLLSEIFMRLVWKLRKEQAKSCRFLIPLDR